MAQNDNTPIKGAFFGISVLFGILILGAWFFDHLTGRGLNSETPVLSIGVYAPAVPDPQWGNPSHGLRCKLSFFRPDPSQFTDTSINVQFENITNDTIAFLFDPNEILKAVSAVNRNKWKLKLVPIPREFVMNDELYEKMYERSVQIIKPKEIFDCKIECQIVNVKKDIGFVSGFFDAVCKLKIDKSIVSKIQSETDVALWTGKVKSEECKIYLTMPHDGGCNDCHGDADYHHGVLQDCRFCHDEDNAILNETCIRCHKRDDQEIYGRRRVLGPQGDFDNPSKHIPGIIKDDDCLVCHDMTMHGSGVVHLIDPNSPGRKIWKGSDTEFCLSCHNNNPPEYVKFPEEKPASYVKVAQGTSSIPETYSYSEYEPFTPDSNGYPEIQNNYPEVENSYPEVQTSGYPDVQTSYPEAGTSTYPDVQTSYPDEGTSGYPDVLNEIEGNAGTGYGDTTMADSMLDSYDKIHSNTGVSIYDKSDFRNSVFYDKGVQCTDCHRSHGSNRHDLLKNIHGKDDKIRI